MAIKGKPIKITKNTVASKCLELYWKKGIQNVTYNDGNTMFGTFKANSQSPKDVNKNSMSIGSNKIIGGTKTYKNVLVMELLKMSLIQKKNISLEKVQFTKQSISLYCKTIN